MLCVRYLIFIDLLTTMRLQICEFQIEHCDCYEGGLCFKQQALRCVKCSEINSSVIADQWILRYCAPPQSFYALGVVTAGDLPVSFIESNFANC